MGLLSNDELEVTYDALTYYNKEHTVGLAADRFREKAKNIKSAIRRLREGLTPAATLLRAYENQGPEAVRAEFRTMCGGDMADCEETLSFLLDAVQKERAERYQYYR